jgi:UDP-N-acetylmuramate dehydrogenase
MSTEPARPRCPACPGSWWPMSIRAASRTCPCSTWPAGPTSAHADRPPRGGRPLLHPGGRRPHLAARRADGRAGLVRGTVTTRARRPGRARPGPRCPGPARSPLGALTTYRVGGPAALFVEPGDEEELVAVARSLTGLEGAGAGAWAEGSNLLVADRGFPGLVITLGSGFETLEIDGTEVVAGAALSLPVLARRTAAAGLPVSNGRWGPRVGGGCGPHERRGARLRHGYHPGLLPVGRPVRPHRWHESPAHRLAFGYRHSRPGTHRRGGGRTHRLEPGDPGGARRPSTRSCAGAGPTSQGGSNAGSVFTNPPGDSAGRLIDELRTEGFADRHRPGVAQARQLHPGRSRWLGRRRPNRLISPRAATVAALHRRHPPAPRCAWWDSPDDGGAGAAPDTPSRHLTADKTRPPIDSADPSDTAGRPSSRTKGRRRLDPRMRWPPPVAAAVDPGGRDGGGLFSTRPCSAPGSSPCRGPTPHRHGGHRVRRRLGTTPAPGQRRSGPHRGAGRGAAFIATAQVERHWPDGVTIAVTERVPTVTVMAGPGAAWSVLDGARPHPRGTVAPARPDCWCWS